MIWVLVYQTDYYLFLLNREKSQIEAAATILYLKPQLITNLNKLLHIISRVPQMNELMRRTDCHNIAHDIDSPPVLQQSNLGSGGCTGHIEASIYVYLAILLKHLILLTGDDSDDLRPMSYATYAVCSLSVAWINASFQRSLGHLRFAVIKLLNWASLILMKSSDSSGIVYYMMTF
jgi:hypothetical protein